MLTYTIFIFSEWKNISNIPLNFTKDFRGRENLANCWSSMKFETVVTSPRDDKTINVRFYGGIGTLYDWRENGVHIRVAFLWRINCKRCIRTVAQVINRIADLRTNAKNRKRVQSVKQIWNWHLDLSFIHYQFPTSFIYGLEYVLAKIIFTILRCKWESAVGIVNLKKKLR